MGRRFSNSVTNANAKTLAVTFSRQQTNSTNRKMKILHKSKIAGLFIIAIFFCPTLFAQTNGSILTDNKLKNKLDTAIDYAAKIYLQDSNTNGVSIGVYYKTKNYTYNYGKSKLATADNFYNIGSVAKTFVTTILAQAAVDKKLNLNDDIRKYLPGQYPNLQYNGKPILMVNLANHTSGLPRTFRVFSSAIQDSLRKLSIPEQVKFYSLYNQDSLLSDLHFVKLDTLPGTKFQYNSSAMMVLVLLLENVYHKPYEGIVTEYLREHLKMYNTKPFLTATEINNAVQGYNNNGKPQQFLNLRGFYFGPTMNSTINDMLKYLKANLSLKEKAIRLTHQLTYGKEKGFGIGLGWMMDNTITGERYIYHDGNTKIGYNTICTLYPGEGSGFIIIVNDTISQDKLGQLENNIKQALGRQ
jgi:CubicO group peptidase (beta-lactamase class C family)